VGTLILIRPEGAGAFGPVEDRLLSALSMQLGVTMERLRLQREATEAEVLRRTDELKTALLNAVSHDLRTPLASIIASAGSLRQQDVTWTDAERQEFAVAIEEEAQRLNGIVGNLLDLSRIEGGSLRPEKGWYDLSALIDDALGRLRSRTADHRIRVAVPADLPPVHLDYVEIDQVLSNLIENAAKYTPAGTEIEVGVSRYADEIQVAVADRGPGIPEAALPRLFEPFYRGNEGGPRLPGTGVGLTVAKGLVEAHGGRVWARCSPTACCCSRPGDRSTAPRAITCTSMSPGCARSWKQTRSSRATSSPTRASATAYVARRSDRGAAPAKCPGHSDRPGLTTDAKTSRDA
jgi:two-component system, OmpR family, sensor histidine kinase KdpD